MSGGIAFLFPGQGSQYVGMGKEVVECYPHIEKILKEAEEISGIPVRQLCMEGPMEELTRTINLQPCLTAVDMMFAKVLMEEGGVMPDVVAGHSLGEYPALWAGGFIDLSDCIRLVYARGKVMDEAASRRPGAMAAIIGMEREGLEDMIAQILTETSGILALANHNSREQIVATGEKHLVDILCKRVKDSGNRAVLLKVSGAYHSPLMEDAAKHFETFLKESSFHAPKFPLYSNVSAKRVMDPEETRELMAKQMRSPVRWYDIVNNMYEDGIRIFIEVGPKKVLSNLVRKSLEAKDFEVLNFESPNDLKKIQEVIG